MSAIITFVQANGQLLLIGGFGLLMLVMLSVQVCLLRRVSRMQRKINAITEKVGNYLEVIMEPEPEQTTGGDPAFRVSEEKMRKEEEESRIISSMLQEIFP